MVTDACYSNILKAKDFEASLVYEVPGHSGLHNEIENTWIKLKSQNLYEKVNNIPDNETGNLRSTARKPALYWHKNRYTENFCRDSLQKDLEVNNVTQACEVAI